MTCAAAAQDMYVAAVDRKGQFEAHRFFLCTAFGAHMPMFFAFLIGSSIMVVHHVWAGAIIALLLYLYHTFVSYLM